MGNKPASEGREDDFRVNMRRAHKRLRTIVGEAQEIGRRAAAGRDTKQDRLRMAALRAEIIGAQDATAGIAREYERWRKFSRAAGYGAGEG